MSVFFGGHDNVEAVYRKLKAAGISTWVLVFKDGKGLMHTRDDVLRPTHRGASDVDWDWDDFVNTMIHPDDRAAVNESMAHALADPANDFRVEYRILDPHDGSWNWLLSFGSLDPPQADGSLRLTGGVQDIRERVETKRLRERELAFNTTLLESLPCWYLVISPEGKILRQCADFGQGFPEDLRRAAQEDWTAPLSEKDRETARKMVADTINGATLSFKTSVQQKNGSKKTFWMQCRQFYAEGERCILILIFDVTAETEAETEVQRQRSQLDAVVTAANLGTWDWDLITGEVIYSKTWADILGYELWEIQGSAKAWEDALVPEDLDKAMSAVQAHVAGETPSYEAEFRMARKDGTIIWALDRGQIVERDEDGQSIRLLGVLQDITAEKKASLDMEISKNQMEMILREVKFGTWDWDLTTDKVIFDDTFFSMLGYSREEVPSNVALWEELLHPEDRERAEAALAPLREGLTDAYETELRIRNKDGHYVWVYDMGRTVNKDDNGRGTRVVGGQLDIDRRIRQEQEQKKALETIARQKAVLEQTVLERTELLQSIRQRVDSIAADTAHTDSLLPGTACASGPAGISGLPDAPCDQDAFDIRRAADETQFAQSLGRAFDVITDKMWWYKAVIDSIPFPIYVTDMEQRWTYLNAPALTNIGANSLNAVLGQKAAPWGVEQPPSREAIDAAGTRAKPIYRYNPERKRFFQGQASYLLDKSGNSIGHIEAMQDVTKTHEADQRTRVMLDTTPLACNFWNDSFECVDCNHAAVVLFKVKDKQEYMQRFFEFMPPAQPDGSDSVPTARENIRRAFAEGYVRFEWMFALPDKTPMPAEITLVRVEHDGKPIALGYIRDLTELKAKTAEVDRERQLLAKIMDSSPVCFVILVHGKVRFATPHARQFFGIGEGSDISEFYTETAERERFFEEVREVGVVNWRVVSVRSAEGAPREMLANAFMAEYFDEPCVMSWFLDVTEMRETERQLRLARDAAEESTKAKGEFLANMSHEIRTPMNAILGMTRLVLDTSLSSRQRGYLEKAEQSARALLRIINDILDFSKIEAGKLEMEETDFLLRDILQAVKDMFRPTAEQKKLYLELNVNAEEPLMLRGDPLRLHQVLINLVGNAFKFTSKGGVTISVHEEERSAENIRLAFSVKDTGIGLERDKAKKLFTTFAQADTSTTRRFGGTGLGLAISKRLVEMMHGEIHCISEPGKGTDFRFTGLFLFAQNGQDMYLPGQAEATEPDKGAGAALVSRLAGKRILVAEDNEINQIVIREMLEKAGFMVDIANDGCEAVAMTLHNQYDLVFMDIQMPRMDGLTATTTLREHEHLRTLPIVAMTAHAMVGDKERSLSAGMNAHVTKPIDPDEVFAVLARWLGQEPS